MKQEYVIAHIKQMGREICMVDTNEISYQHSANLYLEIEVDTSNTSPFKDMLLSAVGKRRGSDKTISCPLVYEDDKSYILLPEALFIQEGVVLLSLGGINDEKVVITSNMVQLEVRESNPIIATITPKEAYWQIEVRNAIQYWYETQIKSDLKQKQETVDELLEESHQQQEHAKQLQQTVDNAIAIVEQKLSEGEFVPEHRWEGPVLYFKNSNGTWDKGFKIPGMDAFNWKVANCIEEATYQANIENWGTIENALLAITFTTAINASKPVLLKINEEEVHPILSGQDAMLAEELEGKSTILRFDGTNWLVQTSQSGTVQSSDKSVKDIVTVTKEELKQLQASGQLVDGTLYQTEEPAEDVTVMVEEIDNIKEKITQSVTSTLLDITSISSKVTIVSSNVIMKVYKCGELKIVQVIGRMRLKGDGTIKDLNNILNKIMFPPELADNIGITYIPIANMGVAMVGLRVDSVYEYNHNLSGYVDTFTNSYYPQVVGQGNSGILSVVTDEFPVDFNFMMIGDGKVNVI